MFNAQPTGTVISRQFQDSKAYKPKRDHFQQLFRKYVNINRPKTAKHTNMKAIICKSCYVCMRITTKWFWSVTHQSGSKHEQQNSEKFIQTMSTREESVSTIIWASLVYNVTFSWSPSILLNNKETKAKKIYKPNEKSLIHTEENKWKKCVKWVTGFQL